MKIGTSSDPSHRIATLQTANSTPLRVMSMFNGGEELEKLLHKKFSSLRVHGEWFHLAPEHLLEAKEVADQYTELQRQRMNLPQQEVPISVSAVDFDDTHRYVCLVDFLPGHVILRSACEDERVRRLLLLSIVTYVLREDRRSSYLRDTKDELMASLCASIRQFDAEVTCQLLLYPPDEDLAESGRCWYSHKAAVDLVTLVESRLRNAHWMERVRVQDDHR